MIVVPLNKFILKFGILLLLLHSIARVSIAIEDRELFPSSSFLRVIVLLSSRAFVSVFYKKYRKKYALCTKSNLCTSLCASRINRVVPCDFCISRELLCVRVYISLCNHCAMHREVQSQASPRLLFTRLFSHID